MRNEKGFTLIEIIAVLVILGILAAVAVPRYVNMAAEAKSAAARGQLAEVKSTLNIGYAKYFIKNRTRPTAIQVLEPEAANLINGPNTFGVAPDDWHVTINAGAGYVVTITVDNRGSDAAYNTTAESWTVPETP